MVWSLPTLTGWRAPVEALTSAPAWSEPTKKAARRRPLDTRRAAFYRTDPAPAACTRRPHRIPAREAWAWGIARQSGGSGSVGAHPRHTRDDPRLSDRGTSLPKRGAEAAKLSGASLATRSRDRPCPLLRSP